MKIQISDHFNYNRLIRFTVPSIVMIVFSSVYNVVDGYFVSNYTGKTQFAAVNLIMPFLLMLSVAGFMLGTGGNAIVSKALGEGKKKKANEIFSMLVYVTIAFGMVIFVLGEITMPQIAKLLGADGEMLPYCILYGRIITISVAPFMLQVFFQSFMATAGKPQIGLAVTLTAGITNIILDFVFVGFFKWGIVGAAAATVTGESLGGIIPLIYFMRKNTSSLRLCKTHFYAKDLLKACTNGSSELMSNLSMNLVSMIYNYQLMKYYGEDGVAAYGTIMYVNFLFLSMFLGYSIGSAPIVGYNYGAKNKTELQNIFKKSIGVLFMFSLFITVASVVFAGPISKIYVGYDQGLFELTVMAFRLFSLSYLIAGYNIYASAFFTALNNGFVSAVISFARTLLFQIVCVFALPAIFGKGAIWLSITVAETFALVVSVAFIVSKNKRYHYIKSKSDSNL
nr:MATE family efflux transporter [Eubacteriales bacterium]